MCIWYLGDFRKPGVGLESYRTSRRSYPTSPPLPSGSSEGPANSFFSSVRRIEAATSPLRQMAKCLASSKLLIHLKIQLLRHFAKRFDTMIPGIDSALE